MRDGARRAQINDLVREYTKMYFPEIKLTNADLGFMIRSIQKDWWARSLKRYEFWEDVDYHSRAHGLKDGTNGNN